MYARAGVYMLKCLYVCVCVYVSISASLSLYQNVGLCALASFAKQFAIFTKPAQTSPGNMSLCLLNLKLISLSDDVTVALIYI